MSIPEYAQRRLLRLPWKGFTAPSATDASLFVTQPGDETYYNVYDATRLDDGLTHYDAGGIILPTMFFARQSVLSFTPTGLTKPYWNSKTYDQSIAGPVNVLTEMIDVSGNSEADLAETELSDGYLTAVKDAGGTITDLAGSLSGSSKLFDLIGVDKKPFRLFRTTARLPAYKFETEADGLTPIVIATWSGSAGGAVLAPEGPYTLTHSFSGTFSPTLLRPLPAVHPDAIYVLVLSCGTGWSISPYQPEAIIHIDGDASCTLFGQTPTSSLVWDQDRDLSTSSSSYADTGEPLVSEIAWDGTAPDLSAEFVGEFEVSDGGQYISVSASFGATLFQLLPYWSF